MSGLYAIFGGDPGELARGLARMDSRGPDGRSTCALPGAALGVAELAPGEPDAAPATDRSGRWTVIADGELLNARALAAELAAWDEAPDTPTTPALAAAFFAARGFVGGLERLAGDVAFVAWDAETRTAWVARDRAGLRPLFLHREGSRLRVASTPDVLGLAPDPGAAAVPVDAALALLPGPSLAPGELAEWRNGNLVRRSWWSETANPLGADGARYRWARSVQFATELAIQQRAAVDAPVALLLSGGVYAEALLAGVAARRREPVLTLTFGVDGAKDERPRAATLAAAARANHLPVTLTDGEMRALFDELAARPEPLLHPEGLALEALARAAWAHDARVLLHGFGAAALFGGAPLPLAERAASLPGLGPLRRLAPVPSPVDGLVRLGVLEAPIALPEAPDGASVGRTLSLQRRVEADGVQQMVDRACAANGLRASAPYADAPLVRLVAGVPAGHLVQVRRPRGLFLDALGERLSGDPPEHAPMLLPLERWLPLVEESPGAGSPRQRWARAVLAAWERAHR